MQGGESGQGRWEEGEQGRKGKERKEGREGTGKEGRGERGWRAEGTPADKYPLHYACSEGKVSKVGGKRVRS